jgi:hypothetical protein
VPSDYVEGGATILKVRTQVPCGCRGIPGQYAGCSNGAWKIAEEQKRYGIQEIIFVGDRGMTTHANYEKVKDVKGLNTIYALTHPQIKEPVFFFKARDGCADKNSLK